jgi:hypothetical protein
MGREALTWAEVGGEAGDVRALLESTELILRGDVRRRFPRDRLARVRVEGDRLRFDCCGEAVALQLGATVAHRWAEAIAKPAPSLRAKLGLAAGARALRVGAFDDAALESALAGVLVDAVETADMIIACISGPADLDAALAIHTAYPALPLWVIHPKGKGVAFGDGEIRAVLRARGFRDTKSCAVSERLTASRYAVPSR